jgi:hypothetical protein
MSSNDPTAAQPPAEAVPGDDPSVAHGPDAGNDGDTPETIATASGTQTVAEPAAPGVDTGTEQPGTEGAEVPDPAGVEPGETTSVPTTRGPGPDDEPDGGAS